MTRMLTTDYFPSCKFQDSPHSLTSSALLLTSGQLQSARCWNNSGMWCAGRHFPFRFPSHGQRGMNGLAGCYGTCNVCCNSFSLKLFGQMNVFYVRFTHVFIFKMHSNWPWQLWCQILELFIAQNTDTISLAQSPLSGSGRLDSDMWYLLYGLRGTEGVSCSVHCTCKD